MLKKNLLPEWFDIKKYESAKQFGSVEWAKNIDIRANLLMPFSWQDKSEARSLIHQYGAVPAAAFDGNYEQELSDSEVYFGGKDGGLVYGLPIWRAEDIATRLRSDDDEISKNLAIIKENKIFHDSRKTILNDEEIALRAWHEDYFMQGDYQDNYEDYMERSRIICVELFSSDEVLIEGFKDWLKKTRAKQDEFELPYDIPTKKFTQKKFDKWFELGILPYLDLKIYGIESGKKIPYHVIGNAIFTNPDIDVAEALRKTTAVHAMQALRDSISLIAQAVSEQNIGKAGKK